MVVLSKKTKIKEHTGVRLTEEELEWLREKVDKGEFASISHGIRRCIDIVKGMEVRGKGVEI